MEKNVYTAPESDLINENENSAMLASRWLRLGGSLLDTLIMVVIIIPLMFITGGFSGITSGVQPSFGYNLMMGVLSIAIFVIINGKFLLSNGQTIGKKIVGTKAVDLDGNVPSPKHLVIRYAVFFLPGQIPLIGQLFSLINVLFIFGSERRCIHDHVAKTKVVKA